MDKACHSVLNQNNFSSVSSGLMTDWITVGDWKTKEKIPEDGKGKEKSRKDLLKYFKFSEETRG